jgi:hypothetical protein
MKAARPAVLLFLVQGAFPLFAADDYVIRFRRPTSVGASYRLDARGTSRERERITMGGQVQNEDKEMSVHLVAVATVLAVDSASAATKMEYLVETCQKTSSGKTEDVLSAGRRVVAEADAQGKTEFTVDGDPALEDIAKTLGAVVSTHRPNSPSDDEIFGTTERKRVGDTWSINSAAAAADFSKSGLTISPEAFKGTVSLDGVRTVGAVQALALSARLTAEGMSVGGEDLPEWLQVEKASLSGVMSALVPADPDVTNNLPDKLKMQIVIVLKGQKPDTGSAVTIEETIEMSLENTYAPARATESARAGHLNAPLVAANRP